MSIRVLNFTHFPNLRYSSTDKGGIEFGVFMTKGAFDISSSGECTLSDEQEPINFTDQFHGALNTTSMRHPSDFVPFKPNTDIIIDAVAYAPGGKPSTSWTIGIQVADAKGVRVRKVMRVTGPRYWVPQWKRQLTGDEKREWRKHRDLFIGWELSEPQPILSLPIRYEYAYGGTIPKGLDDSGNPILDAFEYNPLGRGLIDREWTDHTHPVPAPQIEFSSEPIIEPYKHYYPAGMGPVPSVWLPRRPLGGTYDQKWMNEIWPDWPPDYEFSYHNSAAAAMVAEGFVEGDIEIIFVNLHPKSDVQNWKVRLRDPLPFISARQGEEWQHIRMALDTIYCDIGEAAGTDRRLYLTWRAIFPEDEISEIQLHKAEDEYSSIIDNFRSVLLNPVSPSILNAGL